MGAHCPLFNMGSLTDWLPVLFNIFPIMMISTKFCIPLVKGLLKIKVSTDIKIREVKLTSCTVAYWFASLVQSEEKSLFES
jgi:hypothetical protein